MTIAYYIDDDLIGGHIYIPEGPYGTAGNFPLSHLKFGDVIEGDAESEFVFLSFSVLTAGLTLNQGDAITWDNSYCGVQTGSIAVAAQYPVFADVGTFFLGGRIGDPAAAPNAGNSFSYTFPTVGVYGIFVQRSGTSLLKTGTIQAAAGGSTLSGGGVQLGTIGFTTVQGVHSNLVANIGPCAQSWTFTGTTAVGNVNITAVSTNQGLVKGQTLSGTGVPAGAIIVDIQGSTVTMSLPATAAGSVTITAANGSFFCTTTGGSPILTNVSSIAGLYPNQIVTGTNIAAGSVILSIVGNSNQPGARTVTLSLPTTGSVGPPPVVANNINVTVAAPTTAAPNYLEAFLRWPAFSATTN